MSQENVELVRQLQPAPGIDLTELFQRGDEAEAAAAIEDASPMFTDDFVCVFHLLASEPRPGLAGLRSAWLDWLEPWDSYHAEIERVTDVGDQVLVFSRDFGRRTGTTNEVELKGSAVWTVREGKIARAEFFVAREEALEAVGLSE